MKRLKDIGLLFTLLGVAAACGIFSDPTPENISVRISGSEGMQVLAIYSKVFVAGVDEVGVTQVQVFDSDSVMQTLPIDTIINISIERQFFLQVETMVPDTADVDVNIEIDGRNVVGRSGLIFPTFPWRYVYLFNRPVTDLVEVIL